ncbi:iron ABC transporter permease [Salicola sp. Rm-C-2C1-2]|uniref:FecCD family ABC transporter permease n=1 Tax=Salicola sp. Rm-C-2C1-2 TaxID=3141321 RepID=UPI0032E39C36
MMGNVLLVELLTGFAVGGMLAMAGVLMQVLLRTPLAEPYVLGVSGGAASAGLVCMLLGLSGWWITGSALLMSLFSLAVVFLVGGNGARVPRERLLLTGVVMAAGWSTVISFLLALESSASVHDMLYWLMGDLNRPISPWWGLITLILALVAGWIMAPALDLLVRGDEQAAVLGVEVHRVRVVCYVLAAVLTALAVTLAGPIGFVGLVVPHLVRLRVGARHRILLPFSVLVGGVYLNGLQAVADLPLVPGSVPVGILSAIVGIPVFLYLLQRTRIGS